MENCLAVNFNNEYWVALDQDYRLWTCEGWRPRLMCGTNEAGAEIEDHRFIAVSCGHAYFVAIDVEGFLWFRRTHSRAVKGMEKSLKICYILDSIK